MNEEMSVDHSDQLGDLAKALSKAQAELQDAKKDARNPHFKNTYATLASVRAAVTPTLAKCGLSTLQSFEPHGSEGVCVVTWLLHESGQFIRSRLYLPVSKKDAQGFGSAISYARRYALAAITGIAADDDDDATGAVGNGKLATVAPAPAPQSAESRAVEDEFGARLDTVRSNDELAKIHGEVAKAVQAGALDDKARARLREKSAAAIKRLIDTNAAAQ